MKKLLAMALALVMCLGVTTMAWAEGTASALADSVYVSVSDGDDTNDGTQNTPVKSLQKAMELVKENGTVYILDREFGGSDFFYRYKEASAATNGQPNYSWHISNITKAVTISGTVVNGVKTKVVPGTDHGQNKAGDNCLGYLSYKKDSNDNDGVILTNATVKFENLNFAGRADLNNGNNDLSGVSLVFSNCDFTGVTVGNGAYININPNSNLKSLSVDNCTFTAADTDAANGYLVWAKGAQSVSVTGSTFNGGEKLCGAIHLGDGSTTAMNATITDNKINGVERGIQMAFATGKEDTVTIDRNTFTNVTMGAVILHENMAKKPTAIITYGTDNTLAGSTTKAIVAKVSKDGTTYVDVTKVVVAADGGELVKNEDGSYSVVKNTPEQTPPRYYYNSTTTTDTKADGTKGSPKTFDAGVGIYAVSAILSVTGMAYVGKRKF